MKKFYLILLVLMPLLLQGCNNDKCEFSKGQVIDVCLKMQPGMVGMQKCMDATEIAKTECKRSDLTPAVILQEAAAQANKK